MTTSLFFALAYWAGVCMALGFTNKWRGYEYRHLLLIGTCSLLGAIVIGWLQ